MSETNGGERRCAFFVKKKNRTCRMLAARGSIYCGEHLNQEPLVGSKQASAQFLLPAVRRGKSLGTRLQSHRLNGFMTSTECGPGEPHNRRIPCPLDPKQLSLHDWEQGCQCFLSLPLPVTCPSPSSTVFEHLLAKHLKKCNITKKPIPTCFTANINSGLLGYEPSPAEELPLSAFTSEQIEQLVAKVEKIFSDHSPAMEALVLEHPALASDLMDKRNGPSALKHLKQQASILGHLERLQLLSPHTCYLEFGAGRGKLSHCVHKALRHSADVHCVLIDRANCRRKMDSYHKSGDPGPRFERLLMDIEHLDLSKLHSLRSGVEHIVGISKHLCGAATDLTLRCLLETLPWSCDTQPMRSSHDDITSGAINPSAQIPEEDPESKQLSPSRPRLAAVLVALCCHHRCSWPQFVGREFFEKLGLSSLDFHMLCHMSSWAVCGRRHQPSEVTRTSQLGGDDRCCSGTEGCSEFTGGGESVGTSNCYSEGISGSGMEAQGSNNTEHTHTGLSMEHAGMCMGHSDVSTDLHVEHGSECTDVSDGVSVKQAGMSMEHDGMSLGHGDRGHGYIPHPKESIGLKCKRLIDLGRLAYLEEHDLDARLVYFVEKATSLENVLLVATPK